MILGVIPDEQQLPLEGRAGLPDLPEVAAVTSELVEAGLVL